MAEAFQANTIYTGNDQMIMQCNPHHRQRLVDILCYRDVGALRLGFAARMIVNNDHRMGKVLKGKIDNFARVNRRLVHRAA